MANPRPRDVPSFTEWLEKAKPGCSFFEWAKGLEDGKYPDGDFLPWNNWTKKRDFPDGRYHKKFKALWEEYMTARTNKWKTPSSRKTREKYLARLDGVPQHEKPKRIDSNPEDVFRIDYEILIAEHPSLSLLRKRTRDQLIELGKLAEEERLKILKKQLVMNRLACMDEHFRDRLKSEADKSPLKFQKETEEALREIGKQEHGQAGGVQINIISGVPRNAREQAEVIDVN